MATSILAIHPNDPIQAVGPAPLAIISSHPDDVLAFAHTKLHAFPFRDVPLCWRRLFEEGCIWKALRLIEQVDERSQDNYSGGVEGEHVARGGEWGAPKGQSDWKADVISVLDMALILTGAPGRRGVIDALLEQLNGHCTIPWSPSPPSLLHYEVGADEREAERPRKRRRLSSEPKDQGCLNGHAVSMPVCKTSGTINPPPQSTHRSLGQAHAVLHKPMLRVSMPSLSAFRQHISRNNGPTPLIITDSIEHWPALYRWKDLKYWLYRTHGGRRLVPVELGRSYTDEGWGQQILPFNEFYQRYLSSSEAGKHMQHDYTTSQDDAFDKELTQSEQVEQKKLTGFQPSEFRSTSLPEIGYLAQHDLLSQIPALRADLAIPDYCYIGMAHGASAPSSPTGRSPPLTSPSEQEEPNATIKDVQEATSDEDDDGSISPLLNIWLGPEHTISPLHTDPHHNILAQVVGSKYIRLYPPSCTPSLYPMSSTESAASEGHTTTPNMANTSQLDISLCVPHALRGGDERQRRTKTQEQQQLALFPLFEAAQASCVDGVLRAGECVFVPKGWWHYVEALKEEHEDPAEMAGFSCSVSFWWD